MGQSRPATWGLIAFALVVASDVAYLLVVSIVKVDPQSASPINFFFRVVTLVAPTAVFWVATAVSTSRRAPVLFAALGVTSWTIGAAAYAVLMGAHGYVPSPAWSDIGYLAFYGFMIAAFFALGSGRRRRAMIPVALEAAIAALGTASVLLVLMQPVIDAAVQQTSSRPLTLAYPLLDVALVAITAGYASNPALAGARRIWWFIAGVAVFVATDLAYAMLAVSDEYHAGNLVDIGWPVGLGLMAWWALGFTTPSRPRIVPRSSAALGLIAPVLSVAAAICVLVYASQNRVNVIAVVLATATVALTAVPIFTRQTFLSHLVAGQERVLNDLRELDVAKTEMMATLNHEMRTPLTSILGYLEVVRDGTGGAIPAEADEMLDVVEHGARRLHTIVDEMLVLTRLDSQGLDVQMEPVDVAVVVKRVINQLTPVARGQQVALRLELNGTIPPVWGDDSRLGHAVTTVAENAVKFTPRGGAVTVSLSVRRHVRPVVISVADTGVGVAPGDLPHLFERFFRGTNALQSAVSGSGLGLAIARGIVELHGGRIRAQSVLGEGTTMIITLPAIE